MLSFALQRLAVLLATLLIASIVVFAVMNVLPGDAAQTLLGPTATPEAVAALSHKLGLDQPLLVRYAHWIGGAARGDFGLSYAYGSPIAPLIASSLSISAPLALMAMALAAAIALTAGAYAADQRGKTGDAIVTAASQIGLAIPNFWLAILLVILFAVTLRTARAKGVARGAALWRHALPNALVPVLTIMGLQFANLIAGAIVVENVFVLPGIGRLMLQSISNRDTLVVENCVMLIAVIVIGLNFAVDLACAAIDPRLRARAP